VNHPTNPPVRSRRRILLVEDDAEAARFAVHVLAVMGRFDVTHTFDPAVAGQDADESLGKPVRPDRLIAVATALISKARGAGQAPRAGSGPSD
jgi:DNA-binding response OmpR family regulator